MKEREKNILTIFIITLATFATMFLLTYIPGYLEPKDDLLPLTLKWISIFLFASFALIAIPAWAHKRYVNDFSKIKNIWFFALFGGITGGLLGEQQIIMILPYTILMLIYAYFYKKFSWWKVMLTSYLAGILIENGLNRSPLQAPTLLWVAFFTYPYFVTKIYEHRSKNLLTKMWKDFRGAIFTSPLLILLALYITQDNISPPLIFLAAVLPFLVKIIFKTFFQKKE